MTKQVEEYLGQGSLLWRLTQEHDELVQDELSREEIFTASLEEVHYVVGSFVVAMSQESVLNVETKAKLEY